MPTAWPGRHDSNRCRESLTATSVGITARVLSDLGHLQDKESQVILGAAILDDLIGLVILAVVAGLTRGQEITVWSVAKTTGIAFGVWPFLCSDFLRDGWDGCRRATAESLQSSQPPSLGSNGPSHLGGRDRQVLGGLRSILAPLQEKSVIGVGMIPRGEVGLIFAQMGLGTAVFDAGVFSAVTLMVMATTFMAPPLLKHLLSRAPSANGPPQLPESQELVTEA